MRSLAGLPLRLRILAGGAVAGLVIIVIVVILLMFVGRLGPLTLAATLERRARDTGYRLPEEAIMIG